MQTTKHLNPYFINTEEDSETAVRRLLKQSEWTDELPINLQLLCELNDYELVFEPRSNMREEGTTELSEYSSKIIINTQNKLVKDGFSQDVTERRRQRFTLAHEIGHCFLNSHKDYELQAELITNPNNPHRGSYNRKRESQANGFAANLLIPSDHFIDFLKTKNTGNNCDELITLINEISDTYDVSFEVAINRLATKISYPCLCAVFVKGQTLRVPAYSDDFRETGLYFGKKSLIPKGTSAHRLSEGKTEIQEAFKHPNTERWFPENYHSSDKYKIFERSIDMGKERIISFLEFIENI